MRKNGKGGRGPSPGFRAGRCRFGGGYGPAPSGRPCEKRQKAPFAREPWPATGKRDASQRKTATPRMTVGRRRRNAVGTALPGGDLSGGRCRRGGRCRARNRRAARSRPLRCSGAGSCRRPVPARGRVRHAETGAVRCRYSPCRSGGRRRRGRYRRRSGPPPSAGKRSSVPVRHRKGQGRQKIVRASWGFSPARDEDVAPALASGVPVRKTTNGALLPASSCIKNGQQGRSRPVRCPENRQLADVAKRGTIRILLPLDIARRSPSDRDAAASPQDDT